MATEAGDKLNRILKPAYPQAAIDRVKFPNTSKIPVSRGAWEEKCSERSLVPSPISISLECDYNSTTRNVDIGIIICTMSELPGKYRINVVVCEDSLNYKQKVSKKPYKVIDPYYHKHVVREMITGPLGESLNNAPLASDICILKKYSFTLNSDYNTDLCRIVVFIHEDLVDGIGPVQQVVQTHIE